MNTNDFNWILYSKYYSDLHIIKNRTEGYEHWNNFGINEERIYFNEIENKVEKFDWMNYLDKYPELRTQDINDKEQVLNHWKNNITNEDIILFNELINNEINTFDWKFYLNKYPDLRENGINNKKDAINHWYNHGISEGRICKIEDLHKKYKNEYEHIVKLYKNEYVNQYNKLKKINIAILITGQSRINPLNNSNNTNNIILERLSMYILNSAFKNNYNYDIFISTDNIDINKSISYFGDNLKNIYCSDNNSYLYPIKTNCKTYNEILHQYSQRDYKGCNSYFNNVFQFYRYYHCNNMVNEYLKNEKNKKYDLYIRFRLDIAFQRDINEYIKEIIFNENIYYIGQADFFSLGRVEIMNILLNMIDKDYGTYDIIQNEDRHRWNYAPEVQLPAVLSNYCSLNNLDYNIAVKFIEHFCCIVR